MPDREIERWILVARSRKNKEDEIHRLDAETRGGGGRLMSETLALVCYSSVRLTNLCESCVFASHGQV